MRRGTESFLRRPHEMLEHNYELGPNFADPKSYQKFKLKASKLIVNKTGTEHFVLSSKV